MTTRRSPLLLALAGVLVLATASCTTSAADRPRSEARDTATLAVQRSTFLRRVRLAGTVESVRMAAAIVPRLAGQSTPTLVITKLVGAGSHVKPGDVLVEFDRQDQLRNAFDRRAEYLDLEEQLRKKRAEQAAARAAEETELKQAENDVARADIETQKNPLLPAIDAEKNTLALEQARARFSQLTSASVLKRRAADADLRILEIRRDRARQAMLYAEQNATLMTVRAPFEGLAVLRTTFKGSQMAEVQEGDEVRPGMPVVSVVDPARMRVRARVNQADRSLVETGQPARVLLDAYPDLAFEGRVEVISPLGVTSSLTARVREFVAIIAIEGSHPNLMPDLSAAVDVAVERLDGVLALPREAVAFEPGGAWVRLQRRGGFVKQAVSVGAMSGEQVVVTSGLTEGAVVARRALGGT